MPRSVIIVALLLVIVAGSCKKNTRPTYSLGIPWNLDSLLPDLPTTQLMTTNYLDVAGAFVATKVTGTLTDTSGIVIGYNRSWQAATFLGSSTGSSSVSVNGAPLITTYPEEPFLCRYDSSVAIWNETGANHWETPGSSLVPAISEDVAGTMPARSGSLPTAIDTTRDFTFTFNGDNTSNADYGFVILYGFYSDAHYSFSITSNVVNARGGTATLPVALLKHLYNTNISPSFAVYDPICYGGFIMVVLYNQETHTFGGKPYAFVRQREYLGVVKFM